MKTFLSLLSCSLLYITATKAQTTLSLTDPLKDRVSTRLAAPVSIPAVPVSRGIMCDCGPTKPEDQPVVLVDGERSTLASMRSLDLRTIETVDLSHDEKLIQVYGDLAKNGVIYVTLKKPATSQLKAQQPD
ncbi:hypothetical protein A6C57_26205 [Fibrella sp. ES10-3-2-2]